MQQQSLNNWLWPSLARAALGGTTILMVTILALSLVRQGVALPARPSTLLLRAVVEPSIAALRSVEGQPSKFSREFRSRTIPNWFERGAALHALAAAAANDDSSTGRRDDDTNIDISKVDDGVAIFPTMRPREADGLFSFGRGPLNGDNTIMYRSPWLAKPDDWNAFWAKFDQRTGAQATPLLSYQPETSSTFGDTHNIFASLPELEFSSLPSTISHPTGSFPSSVFDPLWEQIKYEAEMALKSEPQAGPQLYQAILSQPSLLSAICTVVSHEIETELIPATTLKNLFMDQLQQCNNPSGSYKNALVPSPSSSSNFQMSHQEYCIRQDLQAVAMRDPSVTFAMNAILFHNGFHALVCYRVGHCLWQAQRSALAYFMQSTVSRIYSADIHPACTMGSGIYLRVGAGVVIGETAVVEDDVCILEGVTLGGTGKEAGDRHPKVGRGVIVQDGGTVLGNIRVGEGAIVSAKSIVTKPVPPLVVLSGIPATFQRYRNVKSQMNPHEQEDDDLEYQLLAKYRAQWRLLYDELYSTPTTSLQ